MIVYYHADCADGFCCLWLLSRHRHVSAAHAVRYGDPLPPAPKGSDVWMVDFCHDDRQTMLDLAGTTRLTLIDHHKTANTLLPAKVLYDTSKCGARLVAEYLTSLGHKLHNREWTLIDYIEDHDLWKWELKDSKDVSAYISSLPYILSVWDKLVETPMNQIVASGKMVLAYQHKLMAEHAAKARPIMFCGLQAYITNCSAKELVSDVCRILCQQYNVPIGIAYQEINGVYRYSVRTDSQVDVSELCKQFGGGGHKKAAGFETTYLI